MYGSLCGVCEMTGSVIEQSQSQPRISGSLPRKANRDRDLSEHAFRRTGGVHGKIDRWSGCCRGLPRCAGSLIGIAEVCSSKGSRW